MMGKRLFLALAAGALLLPQFAECMPARAMDQQCCGSVPCAPTNQLHNCCKAMTSAEMPAAIPAARTIVHPAATTSIKYETTVKIAKVAIAPDGTIELQQESPPELYTLHSSFLI